MSRRVISLLGVLALLTVALTALQVAKATPSRADAPYGSVAGTVTFSQDCSSGIGVGVAYDGTNLWYSCFDSSPDLFRADVHTGQVTASYNIAGGLGALAYDAKRNAIWAGWGGPNSGDVQLLSLDAGKNVTGHHVAFSTCGDGNCYDEIADGLAYDATDDTIYAKPDTGTVIHHYSTSGAPLGQFNWGGTSCYNSGLAVGGGLLFEGADGCNHIYVVDKATLAHQFDFATSTPTDPNFRDEGLACDPDTFAAQGQQVMWSKEAYSPMRVKAFVIPNGTCGAGGQAAATGSSGSTGYNYAALGDSYQAGVGADDYINGTNTDSNTCRRSFHAYPEHLTDDDAVSTSELRFVACSGATTSDLYTGTSGGTPQLGEKPQLDALDDKTSLVTLGIGGNDVGFADTVRGCIEKHFFTTSCQSAYDDAVTSKILGLDQHNTPNRLNRLQQVYNDVRSRAPHARTFILNYPRFFPVDDGAGIGTIFGSLFSGGECGGLRLSDQLWVNYKESQLDQAIVSSARSMGVEPVDLYNASAGHELCADKPAFLNGIVNPLGDTAFDSYHPTQYGHRVIADILENKLRTAADAASYTIYPAQTLTQQFNVAPGAPSASFSSGWPGSDVVMSLTAPDGRVITRSTSDPNVFHRNGPTSELYYLTNPQPGTWTVSLYGADVKPQGEPTTLSFFTAPAPHRDPVAKITQTVNRHVVTVDAGGSTAPDGTLKSYLWDFGDGTYATTPQATHKYVKAGTYRVTLVVQDDQKALGFATANTDIVLPAYTFSGFDQPVANQPAINKVNAGRAIPIKFGLGGDQGLDVLNTGQPNPTIQAIGCPTGVPTGTPTQIDTAGGSSLQYDPGSGRYTYVWKTAKTLTGCQRLTVKLDDGTSHQLDFQFG